MSTLEIRIIIIESINLLYFARKPLLIKGTGERDDVVEAKKWRNHASVG